MSPVHRRQKNNPGVPSILRAAFPDAPSGLEKLAHIKTDPSTGNELKEPVNANLNSWQAIKFWREFRNLTVHSGGLMTDRFCEQHSAFFEAMGVPYASALRPLGSMKRLQLPNVIFYAMISVITVLPYT
jgi:hypothetical protein